MIHTYPEALAYLYDNLPIFQRIGASAFKKDLTNTWALCEVLDNPQRKFRSIHVAGTNGKGSTSHMLASILQSAGYKTGLYTSPHLKEFTERIRIDGKEVRQDFVISFVNRIKPYIEVIQPSFFEITVAMAFDYFVQEQVDIAVIETGLGGRLDSTNVITPLLSVITNIGWDHKDILGDTLELIAFEKAGIIKPSVPAVVSQRQPGLDQIFTDRAQATASTLAFASDEYTVQPSSSRGETLLDVFRSGKPVIEKLFLPLQGIYQQKNLPGVLKAVDLLREQSFTITDQQRLHGLEHVVTQTGLKGRWQKLGDNPFTVCDTGHNEDGISEVVRQIRAQSFEKLWMILGMVKDKDISNILRLLPSEASYYFCQANIPRALDAHVLAEQAKVFGLTGEVIPDVNEALRTARQRASQGDMIFIGGSTFVVAELNEL